MAWSKKTQHFTENPSDTFMHHNRYWSGEETTSGCTTI